MIHVHSSGLINIYIYLLVRFSLVHTIFSPNKRSNAETKHPSSYPCENKTLVASSNGVVRFHFKFSLSTQLPTVRARSRQTLLDVLFVRFEYLISRKKIQQTTAIKREINDPRFFVRPRLVNRRPFFAFRCRRRSHRSPKRPPLDGRARF